VNKRYQAYHEDLIRLINRGWATKKELLFHLFAPAFAVNERAKKIVQSFQEKRTEDSTGKMQVYEIPVYSGTNQAVLKVQRELGSSPIKSDLFGAYVHGSIAGGEEINYSDFDALVILKDEAFQCTGRLSKVCLELNRISRFFYKYDPLQHHGWFVLTESMLSQLPVIYFPPVLFSKCRSLFEDRGISVQLKEEAINKKEDFESLFLNVADSLKSHLKKGLLPDNAFTLKSVLSQFMLLPALFLQALNQEGIDKKKSFEVAAGYFSKEEWEAMEKVSEIRLRWNYSITGSQKFWLTHSKYLVRKWGRRFAPKVHKSISISLNRRLNEKMLILINSMEEKSKKYIKD